MINGIFLGLSILFTQIRFPHLSHLMYVQPVSIENFIDDPFLAGLGSRSRVFLAPWSRSRSRLKKTRSRSRLEKKSGAGAGKN